MIHFLTIALDAMPFIGWHLPVFNKLSFDWTWSVVEGVALPVGDTAWCKKIRPRLSKDGTHEYLLSVANHPRVRTYYRDHWQGKTAMVNLALSQMREPGLLVQIDADELWTPAQLETLNWAFQANPDKNCAYFFCRYFVGPDIVITSRNTYGNHRQYEWWRAWRFQPGMTFKTHEPPVLDSFSPEPMAHEQTEALGLVFDHYAYATLAQVEFKEKYYGYTGAPSQWQRLQNNTRWPVRLAEFLPWVKDEAMASRL